VILKEGGDSVPFQGTAGAVHKFLVPSMNAALGPDVWQSIDITLVGRRIWVVVNGRAVITDQIIPGTTGAPSMATRVRPARSCSRARRNVWNSGISR
jgi:hypothetical protein